MPSSLYLNFFFSLIFWCPSVKINVLKLYKELLQIAMCKAVKNVVPETLHSPGICELRSTVGGRKRERGRKITLGQPVKNSKRVKGTIFSHF